MVKTRREVQREETTAEIKSVAKVQMTEQGAAALSLRAIARQLGLSTPALYRYFENRDALVTALILDAYNALADAMVAADGMVEGMDFYGRFQAVTWAFREWALQNPADFTLIYGTPIPGYHAPRELTVPAAGRVLQTFGAIFATAHHYGKLQPPERYAQMPEDMMQIITELHRQLGRDDVPEVAITLTMFVWPRVYGLVWGEYYGHFPPGFTASGAFFRVEMDAMCEQFGLIR